MLVTLTISKWGGTKHDKKVSKEVADNHGSDVSMGRYNKKLLPDDALKGINTVASRARELHYTLTLPYDDGGRRILKGSTFFDYRDKMKELEREFYNEVDKFSYVYPDLIEEARIKLNGLFDPKDYEEPRDIKRKFAIGFEIDAMPSSTHFTVQLGQSIEADIKFKQDQIYKDRTDKAVKDIFGRAKSVVEHMVERLNAFQKLDDGKIANNFKSSLVDNIRDLADLIPAINITDDPDIDAFAVKLRGSLCRYSTEALKISKNCREETTEKAEAILKQLKSFL